MKRTSIFIPILLIGLMGCNDKDVRADSVETLTADAAQGDQTAMSELERRTAVKAKELNAAATADDLEMVFQTAMMSGGEEAVKDLAAEGNPFAQTHLAVMLSLDTETAVQARDYLEAAASAGHSPAIFRMSEDYLAAGKLYPYDEAKAFSLAVQAAQAGHPEAMYQTGVRYQYGLLTAPQDAAEAKSWFEKAKAAGHRDAQRQLDELARDAGE